MPTAIQWTEETWNPVTGCTRVSPGCAHCYIERTPPFRMEGRRFARVGSEETTGVRLHPDRLDQPLHWRKPRRVFVCSLADLFHDDIPLGFIVEVFVTMALAREHTFQVLTKRPERARMVLAHVEKELWSEIDRRASGNRNLHRRAYAGSYHRTDWPLPNLWLGVSIENARHTWRADVLREIPTAVRFISAEPLLGSLYADDGRPLDWTAAKNGAGDWHGRDEQHRRKPLDLTGIDWCIVGGESGPAARPFHLEHAREIIHACERENYDRSAGDLGPLAVFVKQLGAKPIEWLDSSASGWPSYHRPLKLRDRKGGDPDEWPADLRIREHPRTAA
jgi:protein gp37